MKKISLFLSALLISATVAAQQTLNGDGYYRVRNLGSGRYCYVTDNHGKVYTSSSSVDVNAIELWKDFDKAVSDPSTIIYIKKVGSEYDLQAQGTGTNSLIGYYVQLPYISKAKAYKCGGKQSGFMKYLCDGETRNFQKGYMMDGMKGLEAEYTYWNIIPMDASKDDSYFGVKPDVVAEGTYYKSMYASFPFKLYSSGMKAFYISRVSNGMAVMQEAVNGMVAADTPIIIACSSASPSDNRLDIAANSASKPADNKLSGNYFMREEAVTSIHRNLKPFDSKTMRLLGTTKEGKLGFIIPEGVQYVPANSAYLKVAEGSPEEIAVVTEEEFAAGIDDITVDQNADSAVYNLNGVRVASGKEAFNSLPAGIYIINGKKIVK